MASNTIRAFMALILLGQSLTATVQPHPVAPKAAKALVHPRPAAPAKAARSHQMTQQEAAALPAAAVSGHIEGHPGPVREGVAGGGGVPTPTPQPQAALPTPQEQRQIQQMGQEMGPSSGYIEGHLGQVRAGVAGRGGGPTTQPQPQATLLTPNSRD